MRMSHALYERLRESIQPNDTEHWRSLYRNFEKHQRPGVIQDINKRYRWDLLYAFTSWDTRSLFSDENLSDADIDTALRRIVPPL